MKTGKNTSLATCLLIIKEARGKVSYSAMASKFGISKSTVGHIVKKWKDDKGVRDLPRSGAPRKTTQRQNVLIRRKSVADPNKNAVQICKEMATEHGLTVNKDTIRRRLDATRLCARVSSKKHLIRAKNRKIRWKFAKEHETWTTKD